MNRLFLRWITIGIVMFIALAGLALVAGRWLNPIPALSYSDFRDRQSLLIFNDLNTGVEFGIATYNDRYRTQLNGQLAYRTARVEDETQIYVRRMWQQRERLVATIPTSTRWVSVRWLFDFDLPMLLADHIRAEEQVALYEIDMRSGTYKLTGTYPFTDSGVQSVFTFHENAIIIRGEESETIIINQSTGETIITEMEAFSPAGTDNNYLAYTTSAAGDRAGSHIILNMETFQQIDLPLPSDDTDGIALLVSSAPDDTLFIRDDNDHLWFYDISEATYQALPQTFRAIRGSGWHPDGTKLLLANIIDESQNESMVEFGIYTPATDSFVTFFTATAESAAEIFFQTRIIQWSPDGAYVLVSDSVRSDGQTGIYDGTNGKLIVAQDSLPDFDFLMWGFPTRLR